MEEFEKAQFKGDRDQVIKDIIKTKLNHADSHLGKLKPDENLHEYLHPRGYNYYSKTNRLETSEGISFVIAPAWGVLFPPYNIARLTGLLRHYGYKVDVHDVNIECHQYLLDNNFYENPDIDNWWHGQFYWVWSSPTFQERTLPALKPVLDAAIDRVIEDNNPIVGFSLYTSNIEASMYMIKRLKDLRPDIKVAVGGPQAFNEDFEYTSFELLGYDRSLIDYRITGEGEQEILTLLENYEEFSDSDIITLGGFKSKLDLNQLPFPDYSDYDLNLYDYSNGVSIETSRGCVAQCTFCAETWFWKYRFRTSDRVIEEMKHQINRYGTKHFWFVDSLANGAFKEFKNLVHNIVDDRLDISWNSYARCDGRMDLDLFKKIKESGCQSLSFGVESGSPKVLSDMKKKIAVWEIEDNLRDGSIAGLYNHVNWVVGFPTEGPSEFLHSLQVVYNIRNWVYAISPGATCNLSPFSDININWKNYNIAFKEKLWDNSFMNNWYTVGYANTIIHRFIRLKFMNIWLHLARTEANGTIQNAQHQQKIESMFKFERTSVREHSSYLQQRSGQNFKYFEDDFSASLANEYLPYAWLFYKAYGPYKFEMINDRDLDNEMFGPYTATPYWARVNMEVDENEKLTFNLTHKFNHTSMRGVDDQKHVIINEHSNKNMSFDERIYTLECDINDFNGIEDLIDRP